MWPALGSPFDDIIAAMPERSQTSRLSGSSGR
jgi:hypothetical protein